MDQDPRELESSPGATPFCAGPNAIELRQTSVDSWPAVETAPNWLRRCQQITAKACAKLRRGWALLLLAACSSVLGYAGTAQLCDALAATGDRNPRVGQTNAARRARPRLRLPRPHTAESTATQAAATTLEADRRSDAKHGVAPAPQAPTIAPPRPRPTHQAARSASKQRPRVEAQAPREHATPRATAVAASQLRPRGPHPRERELPSAASRTARQAEPSPQSPHEREMPSAESQTSQPSPTRRGDHETPSARPLAAREPEPSPDRQRPSHLLAALATRRGATHDNLPLSALLLGAAPAPPTPPTTTRGSALRLHAVGVDGLQVHGALPLSVVRRGLTRLLPRYSRCGVKCTDAAHGCRKHLPLSAHIDETGRGRNARAGRAQAPDLQRCLERVTNRLVVSAPDTGTVRVRAMLRFEPP